MLSLGSGWHHITGYFRENRVEAKGRKGRQCTTHKENYAASDMHTYSVDVVLARMLVKERFLTTLSNDL